MKISIRSVRLALLMIVATATLAVGLVALGEDDGYTGPNTEVTTGPDVTIWDVARASGPTRPGVNNWTQGTPINGIRAYSISTDSCNIGSQTLKWCDESNCADGATSDEHPVIAQNLYRLHNGSFRQIGKNWLKHGFNALNTNVDSTCVGNDGTGSPTAGCTNTGGDGDFLFVGCTDLYWSTTNGNHNYSGARSEVNGRTGEFPFPEILSGDTDAKGQRIQVLDTDLIVPDVGMGIDPKYWVEAHYVTPDDAMAGNGLNNASYREVLLGPEPDKDLTETGDTVREAAAIWAWKAEDPSVEIERVDLGTTPIERLHVARRVTGSARGIEPWHYEVVVHNLNSEQAARALEIQFPGGTTFSGSGFHDVDSHSGEVYDSTDWTITTDSPSGTIRWELQDAHLAPADQGDANAIRWGTAYTFWFDASAPPDSTLWQVELFDPEPGIPSTVTVPFEGIFTDGFESGTTTSWSTTVP